MKRRLVVAALAATVVGIGTAVTSPWVSSRGQEKAADGVGEAITEGTRRITIWRDPGCGCCDVYAEYLEANGYQVTRVDDRGFDKRSVAAGVPEQGLGCHLAEIGSYYVSGLVPVEIIERLLTERPPISGITLPGMPANAPGMAVQKSGVLKTYAFGPDGVSVYSNE